MREMFAGFECSYGKLSPYGLIKYQVPMQQMAVLVKMVIINPHPRLQKNLQVYRWWGPHGPQKRSSAV